MERSKNKIGQVHFTTVVVITCKETSGLSSTMNAPQIRNHVNQVLMNYVFVPTYNHVNRNLLSTVLVLSSLMASLILIYQETPRLKHTELS